MGNYSKITPLMKMGTNKVKKPKKPTDEKTIITEIEYWFTNNMTCRYRDKATQLTEINQKSLSSKMQ